MLKQAKRGWGDIVSISKGLSSSKGGPIGSAETATLSRCRRARATNSGPEKQILIFPSAMLVARKVPGATK